MALNSSKIKGGGNGGNRVEQPVIDAGVYPSRIVQMLDLGLQNQRPYQGKDKPPANEVMITYELVDSFMIDEKGNELEDKPRWISETLPLYDITKADKAKCTQRYNAADPTNAFGGDFSQIVDVPVNVSLVHNQQGEKLYVNVANIAAMRPKDAAKCPALKNPPKVFDLDEPDMEVFNSLPDWVQDKIKKNLNFNGSKLFDILYKNPAMGIKAGIEAERVTRQEQLEQTAQVQEESAEDKPWD